MPRAEYDALQQENRALKTQLDWFKRQLFGEKPEKRRIFEPATQADEAVAVFDRAHGIDHEHPNPGIAAGENHVFDDLQEAFLVVDLGFEVVGKDRQRSGGVAHDILDCLSHLVNRGHESARACDIPLIGHGRC